MESQRSERTSCWVEEDEGEEQTDVTLQEDYESSVSQEKQDVLKSSSIPESELKTTLDDLHTLLQLRKRKREKKSEVFRAAAPVLQSVPYYVDEEDFFKACEQNQLPVIDRYLSIGGDINACDNFQRTGLHRACSQGHTEVVQRLLESGTNIHSKDKLLSSCLHAACRGGNLSVLKLLLDHGGDVTARDKLDSSPLHVAVRTGQTECAEHLIHCGAELNVQDREGDTPLHDAVRLNRFKMVQLLLLHGANTHLVNQEGKSPLEGALQWQNEMKTLLSKQNQRK